MAFPGRDVLEIDMAHLWSLDASQAWSVQPLDSDPYPLDPARSEPVLVRTRSEAGAERWALVGAVSSARVNGEPLAGFLRVLADRDEIRIAGRILYFSTETPARVEPLPAGIAGRCPRCKQAIPAGSEAVRCPGCGTWHHQSERLPCWTYAARCALCDRGTDLGGTYQWTPEEG